MTQHDYADLRTQLETIRTVTGTGTELVTLSVPAGKNLNSVKSGIQAEHADAENIKSDETRKHVQKALSRVNTLLSQYRTTPENGMIIYCGMVDGSLLSFVFDDLPVSVTASRYQCSNQFDVSLLESVLESQTGYGLIVVERGSAIIGEIRGDSIHVHTQTESHVMGKTRAGGQSAQRFARRRKEQLHSFLQTVASQARSAFIDRESSTVQIDGLAVGGSLGTASKFVSDDFLDHRLREQVVGTYGVEYATRQGLKQLFEASSNDLSDTRDEHLNQQLNEFYARLRDDEAVVYGQAEVKKAIRYNAVATGLLSTELDTTLQQTLKEQIENQGGEVVQVAGTTDNGNRFNSVFNGIGALLRFPVK